MTKNCSNHKKYKPFENVQIVNRKWPDKTIEAAPIWCSVDLRDGNQALINPMSKAQKLEFFKLLVKCGFKEIEVGFPSSNQTEFDILRELIEGNYIPDDVTIQVLVQCREHLIVKTFEAIKGAKNAIIHFYNSTSRLQREVVFEKDQQGITDIAVKGARLIKDLSKNVTDTNLRFEYSPESFSGTEIDFAVEICNKVMQEIGATKENKIILNLPATVEMSTPNRFADQIEYFCENLKNREAAIISVHTHNDRGTGIAAAEMAILAGAQRVEGTLFGNGERTGNTDIITLALNMLTQGINPELNFSNIHEIRKIYEESTGLLVHERHPYAGDLVFTAFSGSHQDAINKGILKMQKSSSNEWAVPYLPIDPKDVGREYEPLIRINSQSGKGGAAFILRSLGYDLPKKMHMEFGEIITKNCDEKGSELSVDDVLKIFEDEYINAPGITLSKQRVTDCCESGELVKYEGTLTDKSGEIRIVGEGVGPLDAFFNAVKGLNIDEYEFVDYSQHAISQGSDSKAVAYVELKNTNGKSVYGVGVSGNTTRASVRGILSAINRDSK